MPPRVCNYPHCLKSTHSEDNLLCYYSQTLNSQFPFQNQIQALSLYKQNPIRGFFFPALILKISILLSGIQIFPFSKYKFCNCSFLPTSTSTASQCFKHQAGFKFKVLDFSALRSLCKWQHFLNKLTIWGRGWGVHLTSFGIASPFLRSERSAWLCSLCLECPHLSLARVAGQGFWSSLHIFPPWRQN